MLTWGRTRAPPLPTPPALPAADRPAAAAAAAAADKTSDHAAAAAAAAAGTPAPAPTLTTAMATPSSTHDGGPILPPGARLDPSLPHLLAAHAPAHIGAYLYAPSTLLPPLDRHVNATFTVRVARAFLAYENPCVRKRAVWGTGIYTDDSDLVAMLLHSGALPLPDPTTADHLKPSTLTDMDVTLRVYPRLASYPGSLHHGVHSRDWRHHDGVSLAIEAVKPVPRQPPGALVTTGRRARKARLNDALRLYKWTTRTRPTFDAPAVDAVVTFAPAGHAALAYHPALQGMLASKSFFAASVQDEFHFRYAPATATYTIEHRRAAPIPFCEPDPAKVIMTDVPWTALTFRPAGIKVGARSNTDFTPRTTRNGARSGNDDLDSVHGSASEDDEEPDARRSRLAVRCTYVYFDRTEKDEEEVGRMDVDGEEDGAVRV
ncbi:hypothetical protein AMAG_10080 [Allomyces macrogynus ATCC 38327]|uniref:Histone deacetylation protein Rxt3 n=1 Tax=Allomyces macrogynus (strain ATCC 38327) TaxID=578462 RepID=A0A0L0SQU2_ALLM3|nr:hypothetical protein AMAG_10080 [Allomyces macrogynus ATCC 38327]|eukprot:KNE64730.1 hypothetical protein AMAG_10080 [Allomyces macrogynus ATCC 38327]